MKKMLLIPLMILTLNQASAQNQDAKSNSKSEAVELMQKEGVLLKKDYYKLGDIGIITFQNLVLTNITTGYKSKALVIEREYGDNTYTGTLDEDELSGCIKSLTYMKQNILNSMPSNYSECIYRTKDGVEFAAYRSKNKWNLVIKTVSYTFESAASIYPDKIDELINILTKSLDDLKKY